MKTFVTAIGLLVLSAVVIAADAPPATLAGVDWIAGDWVSVAGQTETEESWLAPKGKLMLGMNRTTRTGGKTAFEFLRIAETAEGLAYIAQPGGAPPTPFKLKTLEGKSVVFENLDNDFPHRVIYRLEGETLHARIEGTINGKERSMDWQFRRKDGAAEK